MGQVVAEETRPFGDRYAVRAAGNVAPFQRHRKHQLREGERQHQERNAAGAYAKKADQRRAASGNDNARSDAEPGIDAELRAEHGDRISAQSEESGVAERHQTGETEQEIEAHGEDREDKDLRN